MKVTEADRELARNLACNYFVNNPIVSMEHVAQLLAQARHDGEVRGWQRGRDWLLKYAAVRPAVRVYDVPADMPLDPPAADEET